MYYLYKTPYCLQLIDFLLYLLFELIFKLYFYFFPKFYLCHWSVVRILTTQNIKHSHENCINTDS